MKKLSIMIAFIATMGAASAFAASTYGPASGDANGNVTIGSTVKANLKLSANVKVEYKANASAPNQGYSLAAYHTSGSKTYGTSSGDTRIYFVDETAKAATAAPAAGATADFSAWTPMQ